MKRNSSLCFLVNIGRSLFAALRSRRRDPARLDLAQTVNERYTFALRSASPLRPIRGHLPASGGPHPPLPASAKAASRGSMTALLSWRLRCSGRPASANQTAAWPLMLDPRAAARGWVGVSDAVGCDTWEYASRRR